MLISMLVIIEWSPYLPEYFKSYKKGNVCLKACRPPCSCQNGSQMHTTIICGVQHEISQIDLVNLNDKHEMVSFRYFAGPQCAKGKIIIIDINSSE